MTARIVSVVGFFVVWQVAALMADSSLLPGPLAVASAMAGGIASGDLPYHLAITLLRVAASFVLAFFIGAAVGVAMGRSPRLDAVLDPLLIFFLNIPALVVIILCYVWFGLVEAAAVMAVAINKIPNVAVTMREGARALDRDYAEMAAAFRVPAGRTFRQVVLPQLYPFAAAAARSGLALIWKIVLVVELLGRSNGVGFQLHLYFQLFDVTNILAYSMAFICVILALEFSVIKPVEAHVTRWRR